MIKVNINFPKDKESVVKKIIDLKIAKIMKECSKKEVEEIIKFLEKNV